MIPRFMALLQYGLVLHEVTGKILFLYLTPRQDLIFKAAIHQPTSSA